MNKVTVIFAIGGEGQRFGGKYKPFLKVFDKYFIQAAMEPFMKHVDLIDKFVFVVNNEDFDFTGTSVDDEDAWFHPTSPTGTSNEYTMYTDNVATKRIFNSGGGSVGVEIL